MPNEDSPYPKTDDPRYTVCQRCNRPVEKTQIERWHRCIPLDLIKSAVKPVTFYIVHDYYGCGSGCCGSRINLNIDGYDVYSKFEFYHVESLKQARQNFSDWISAGAKLLVDHCEFRCSEDW